MEEGRRSPKITRATAEVEWVAYTPYTREEKEVAETSTDTTDEGMRIRNNERISRWQTNLEQMAKGPKCEAKRRMESCYSAHKFQKIHLRKPRATPTTKT